MPVLREIGGRLAGEGIFKGRRIALSIHLEAKTANLALALRDGGAEVVVTGSNPLSTQDDVAAALAERGGSPSLPGTAPRRRNTISISWPRSEPGRN